MYTLFRNKLKWNEKNIRVDPSLKPKEFYETIKYHWIMLTISFCVACLWNGRHLGITFICPASVCPSHLFVTSRFFVTLFRHFILFCSVTRRRQATLVLHGALLSSLELTLNIFLRKLWQQRRVDKLIIVGNTYAAQCTNTLWLRSNTHG